MTHEYKIIIPMADNNQRPFPQHTIDSILRDALAKFGGYTYGPVHHGAWVGDNGKVDYDLVRPLYVCADGEELTLWAESLAVTLGQTCIYMALISDRVQFIYKR